MKYVSLPESYFHVLDTVKSDIVVLGCQLQFHATPSVMPGSILFSRSPNNTPGLMPIMLGSRNMVDGNWYFDLVLAVVITPSC